MEKQKNNIQAMMKNIQYLSFLFLILIIKCENLAAQSKILPDKIRFVRQGVSRFLFDEHQKIPLAILNPKHIIGMSAMHPITHYLDNRAKVTIVDDQLSIQSDDATRTSIWFGGFNPFATYTIDLGMCKGEGEIGFEFSDAVKAEQFFITVTYHDEHVIDVHYKLIKNYKAVVTRSIAINPDTVGSTNAKLILQMLGSGLTLYAESDGLLAPIGQCDFAQQIDLRRKKYINSFQSNLYLNIRKGQVMINKVESALSPGIGLADVRAMTYEDGEPLLDQGRLWYTMTIRGRALPHHIQGVFSMNPTVFDLRLEGVILFDRNDGLLRNEVASHIFYNRRDKVWRGSTTGFSAFADPEEQKQLLAVESKKDPRFGFSVMSATPFGIAGDIEDPHILFDEVAEKWRILTCKNQDGYKAVMLESESWNKGYKQIAGPVKHNSTGTSIQKIGNERYCFSGSKERKIYIYTYPDLQEMGTLNMDLPPWDESSGTRVWPNVVQLPEGYPFRYVALMMDRFNYPGLKGHHWSYGALYLFHGYDE